MIYINDNWRHILAKNDLQTFDDIWNLEAEWFETPNKRRGGWSGVSKIQLKDQSRKHWVFLKRQENHLSRSIRHPFGIPTFQKEFENIKKLDKAGIDTLVPVFFGTRNKCSILITEALSDYISLFDLTEYFRNDGLLPKALRFSIIASVANFVRQTHDSALVHNCLYPNHILLRARITNNQLICKEHPHVRYIDLEKAKSISNRTTLICRDLDTLNRRTPFWSNSDRMYFFKQYMKQKSFDRYSKRIARILADKARGKSGNSNFHSS